MEETEPALGIPEQVEWFWLDAGEGRIPWIYVDDSGEPHIGDYVVDKGSVEWAYADDPDSRVLLDLAVIATHRAR